MGKASNLDCFVMGTSSGLIFLIDSHCIGGPGRSIVLEAIDIVRRPYNSDFVFIKSPPSRPSHRVGRVAVVFRLQATRPICRFFVARKAVAPNTDGDRTFETPHYPNPHRIDRRRVLDSCENPVRHQENEVLPRCRSSSAIGSLHCDIRRE
jgi:hypothetical protein